MGSNEREPGRKPRARAMALMITAFLLGAAVAGVGVYYLVDDDDLTDDDEPAPTITDSDSDGYEDTIDAFPADPSQWSDIDGDGYGDNLTGTMPDLFRDDPTEWNDTDGDGVGDNSDAFPDDPNRWDLTTPLAVLSKVVISYGIKVSFIDITEVTNWSDITVVLSDGANTVSWSPVYSELDGGSAATHVMGPKLLGLLTVFCNATDVAGNGGLINSADYLTFTTGSVDVFSAGTTYTMTVIFEPTGEHVCAISWTG